LSKTEREKERVKGYSQGDCSCSLQLAEMITTPL